MIVKTEKEVLIWLENRLIGISTSLEQSRRKEGLLAKGKIDL